MEITQQKRVMKWKSRRQLKVKIMVVGVSVGIQQTSEKFTYLLSVLARKNDLGQLTERQPTHST